MKVKIEAFPREALYLVQLLLCLVQVKATLGVVTVCYQKQVTRLQRLTKESLAVYF